MIWEDILNEVKTRGTKRVSIIFKNVDKKNSLPRSKGEKKMYKLGGKHGKKYFSQREAECMVYIMRGKTIAATAKILKLSPRTVEFYLKNMKSKLGCRTKNELIELVLDSDFLQHVDFI